MDLFCRTSPGRLNDEGKPFFSPSEDNILFSVRRGSQVIGLPDSLLGLPIEEGDILAPPAGASGLPSIFITAESLGLATTRAGTAEFNAGDELDALDVVASPCDLNFDGECNVADINTMYSAGDLVAGVSLPGPPADYDLKNDLSINNGDLDDWLVSASVHNGFATPYRRGDTALDRDVDVTDFNHLTANFDSTGVAGPHPWEHGNFDGDGDVDITDYNILAANFASVGYSSSIASIPEPNATVLAVVASLGVVIITFRGVT